jgi:hypothetical protein
MRREELRIIADELLREVDAATIDVAKTEPSRHSHGGRWQVASGAGDPGEKSPDMRKFSKLRQRAPLSVGLPGQQRPSERLWATPRRLADKPAPLLHSARPQKKPRQGAGLSQP